MNWLWLVWCATWIAAVAFSTRTRTRTRTRRKADFAGPHRWLSGVGAVLLFVPARSDSGHGVLGWARQRA